MKHCNVNRWKNRSRRGFTLMELLIVVGIIAILAGTTIVSVTTLIPSLRQKELDNSAREIFLAAQNRLTMMQATGELIVDPVDDIGLQPLTWAGYETASCKVLSRTQIEAVNGANKTTVFDSDTLTVGEFSGDYIVEYSKETAQVIAVFCANESLDYATVRNFRADDENWRDEKNSSLRRTTSREKNYQLVGYYDFKANKGELDEKGNNEGFTITVTPLNAEELYLYIKLNGIPTGCTASVTSITMNGVSLNGALADRKAGSDDTEFWILLDKAVDGYRFADLNTGIAPGDEVTVRVTAIATATDGSKSYGAEATSVSFNSLYADGSDVAGHKASIACVRHLENLTYSSQKGFTSAKQTGDIDFAAAKAKWNVNGTISFNAAGAALPSYNSVTLSGCSYDGQGNALVNFVSKAGIFDTVTTAAAGEMVTLENITIVNSAVDKDSSNAYSANAGSLAGTISNCIIGNCRSYIDDTKAADETFVTKYSVVGTTNVGGLIGAASNSTINASFAAMWKVTANSTDSDSYAGGLVGRIENGEIVNSYADTCQITAKNAGGFAGKSSAKISGCYAVTEVLSADAASGTAAGFIADISNASNVTNNYAMIGSAWTEEKTSGKTRCCFAPGSNGGTKTNYYIVVNYTSTSAADLGAETGFDELKDKMTGFTASTEKSHPYSKEGTHFYQVDEGQDNSVFPGLLATYTVSSKSVTLPHYGNWPSRYEGNGEDCLVRVKVNPTDAGDDWNSKYEEALRGLLWLYTAEPGDTIDFSAMDSAKLKPLNTKKNDGAYTACHKNGDNWVADTVNGNHRVLYKLGDDKYIELGTVNPSDENFEPLEVTFYTLTAEVLKDGSNWTASAPSTKCTFIYNKESYESTDLNTVNSTNFPDHTYLLLQGKAATFIIDDSGTALTQNQGQRREDRTMNNAVELHYYYYSVTYNYCNGTTPSKEQLFRGGETVNILGEIPTWTGHSFLRWEGSDGNSYMPSGYNWYGTGFKTSFTINAKMTLDAKWGDASDSKLVLNKNCLDSLSPDNLWNGASSVDWENPVLPNYSTTSNYFVRTNYNFIGWNTKADGSGYYYAPGDYVYNATGAAMNLYAQWTYKDTITVVYNGNGASGGTTRPTTFSKTLRKVQLSYNGYTHNSKSFGGWYYQEIKDGKLYKKWKTSGVEPYEVSTADLINLVKDTDMPWLVKLYANWAENAGFSVTLNLEKMSRSDGMVNAYRNEDFYIVFEADPGYNLPTNPSDLRIYVDANRDGKFSESELLNSSQYSWNSKTGELNVRAAMVKGPILIAAGATPGKQTIGFISHSCGTDSLTKQYDTTYKYTYGTYVEIPDINKMPVKTAETETENTTSNWADGNDGFVFTGWKDENGKIYHPGDTFMVENNMDFTAQWETGNAADTIGVFTWNYYRQNVAGSDNISTQINYFVPNGEIQYVDTGTTKQVLENSGEPYFIGQTGQRKVYCYGLMLPDNVKNLQNFTVTIEFADGHCKEVDLSTFSSTDNADKITGSGVKDSVDGVTDVVGTTTAKTEHRNNVSTDAKLFKGMLVPDTATDHLMQRPGGALGTSYTWNWKKLRYESDTSEDVNCGKTYSLVDTIRNVFGKYEEDAQQCNHMRKVKVKKESFPSGYNYFFFSNVNDGTQLLSEVVAITVTQKVGTETKTNRFDFYYYDRPYHIRNKEFDGTDANNKYFPAKVSDGSAGSESAVIQQNFQIQGLTSMVTVSNGNLPTLSRTYANFFKAADSQADFSAAINENGYTCRSVLLRNSKGNVVVTENGLWKDTTASLTAEEKSMYSAQYQFNKSALAELPEGKYTVEFYFETKNGKIPLEDPVCFDLNVYSGTGYRYVMVRIDGLESNSPYGDGDNANARYVQLADITFSADENGVSTYKFSDDARIYDLQTGTENGAERLMLLLTGLDIFNLLPDTASTSITYEAAAPGEDAYQLIDNNASTKFCERYNACNEKTNSLKALRDIFSGGLSSAFKKIWASNEPKFKTGMYNYLLIDVGEGYQFSQNLYPYISYTTASDSACFISKTSFWGSSTVTLRSPTALSFFGTNNSAVLSSITAAKTLSNWDDLTGQDAATGQDRLNIELEPAENKTKLKQLIRLNNRFVGPFQNSATLEYDLIYLYSDGSAWEGGSYNELNTYGDKIITYTVPVAPTGKYFHGWTTEQGSDTVEYLPGDHLYLVHDITLYPVFKATKPQWTLIYNANLPDGKTYDDLSNMPKMYRGYGNVKVSSLIPKLTGCTFEGWTRVKPDSTGSSDMGDMINPKDTITLNQNIILYAKWSTDHETTETLVYLEDYDNETIWQTGAENPKGRYTVSTDAAEDAVSDTRLTYKVTEETVTVTVTLTDASRNAAVSYYIGGTETKVTRKQVQKVDGKGDPVLEKGQPVMVPAVDADGNPIYEFTLTPTRDTLVKIKVRFEDEFKIIYYPNYDELNPAMLNDGETLLVENVDIATLSTYTVKSIDDDAVNYEMSSGAHFAGWNTEADGTGFYVDADHVNDSRYKAITEYTGNGELKLYAQWRWKVTYNLNGGAIDSSTEAQEQLKIDLQNGLHLDDGKYYSWAKNKGTPDCILLDIVTKTEGAAAGQKYVLDGWYDKASGGTEHTLEDITGDIEVYANFTLAYELTFKINDRDKGYFPTGNETVYTMYVKDGSYFGVLPEPMSCNQNTYRFEGWVYKVGSAPITEETKYDHSTMGTDFTATWGVYYKVTYVNNTTKTYRYLKDGDSYMFPTAAKVNSNYTFVGWSKTSGDSNAVFVRAENLDAVKFNHSNFDNANNIVLYAKWKKTVTGWVYTYNVDSSKPFLIGSSKNASEEIVILQRNNGENLISKSKTAAYGYNSSGERLAYLQDVTASQQWQRYDAVVFSWYIRNGDGSYYLASKNNILRVDSVYTDTIDALAIEKCKWSADKDTFSQHYHRDHIGKDDDWYNYAYYDATNGVWRTAKNDSSKHVYFYQQKTVDTYTTTPPTE